MLLAIGLLLSAASVWFIGGKPKKYDNVRTVKAQAYQVFPYLVDPDLKKRWRDGLVEQRLVSDEMGEEAELRTVLDMEDGQVEFEDRVIRYAKNEIVSIRSKSSDLTATSVIQLKPRGEETEIDFRRIIRLGGMKRFMSVFAEDLNQRALDEDLTRLIKIVEDETDHTIPDPDAVRVTGEEETTGPIDESTMEKTAPVGNSAG